MRTPNAPVAMFIADSIALDFLNSTSSQMDPPVEWLGDGEALLSWLRKAELVPMGVLDEIRANTDRRELDSVAGRARELREWFRTFVIRHMGRSLSNAVVAELAPINSILESDEAFGQIVIRSDSDASAAPTQLAWASNRRWRSPDALLIPVAEAIARLVTKEDFADIKACQGHKCSMMFVDQTRGRARRWCSMAICGNRAKQAAHRERVNGASHAR